MLDFTVYTADCTGNSGNCLYPNKIVVTDKDAFIKAIKMDHDMHPKSWTLLEVHIFMVKTGRRNKKYSPEFKISVIIDMREHHLG